MKIKNSKEITKFMYDSTRKGGLCVAVKGPPPIGLTYVDGTPVVIDVNLAWKNEDTGDVIYVIYE